MVIDRRKFFTRITIILSIVLAIILCICAIVNKDDKSIGNTENDYNNVLWMETEEFSKEYFMDVYNKISNAVSQRLLDGTVYNNETLHMAVDKYNNILASKDWSEFGIDTYLNSNGIWYLNSDGILKFKLNSNVTYPAWAADEEVLGKIQR